MLEAIRTRSPLIYNNPKPLVFGPIAELVYQLEREHLHENPMEASISIAAEPIRIASKVLKEGALPRSYGIGGRVHAVAISPDGKTVARTFDPL